MAHVNESKIITGLPQTPEGVPPELWMHFYSVYSAIHNLERFISQYTGVDDYPQDMWSQLGIADTFLDGNLNRLYLKCTEAVSYGQAVSPVLSTTVQVRLANATNNTRWCCGFVESPGSFAIGDYVMIKTRGLISGISGMGVPGRHWLSTTAGAITNAPPVAAGNIEQVVGWAVSSSQLISNLDSYFVQH